jgi:aldehyde:ferredoxin oxidoreductase
MKGWMGKVLRVDLTQGKVWDEPLDERAARDYIGGRGLGIHYLLDELDPAAEPLGPENMMVLATGPLTGTKAPTGARYMITTKSPLTGALTCSNSGGRFPTEFKKTGYDAVIVKGRAAEPIYLWIGPEGPELRPAGHIWGRDTHTSDEAIRAETDPKARAAVIGPAGERGVLFASVMNDKHRAAGRSGVGAVWGAKNLKGLAVRGREKIGLADEAAFKAANKRILGKFNETIKDNPSPLRLHGTAVTAVGTQNFGVLPTRNWQTGRFDGWEKIYGVTLTEKYLVKNSACFSCPIGCGRVTKVEVPGFEGQGEGPEYETIYAMGSNCGIDNLAAITKANYVCNELGLDTISMGATLACAMELYENGYIGEDETGMPLRWGDGAALVEMTPADRECGRGSAISWPRAPCAWPPPTAIRSWPWWPRARSSRATNPGAPRPWAWPTPPRPSAEATCGATRPISSSWACPPPWTPRNGRERPATRPNGRISSPSSTRPGCVSSSPSATWWSRR